MCCQVARKRIRNKPGNQAGVKPTASKPVPVNVTHSPVNDINEKTHKTTTSVSPIQVAPIGITAHHSPNILSVSSSHSISDNINVSTHREIQNDNMLHKKCTNTPPTVNDNRIIISTVTIEGEKFNESNENTTNATLYTIERNKQGNIDQQTIVYDERNQEKCNLRASIDFIKETTTTASVGETTGDVDQAGHTVNTTHVNTYHPEPVKLSQLDVHTLRDAKETENTCSECPSSSNSHQVKHEATNNNCSSFMKSPSLSSSCRRESIDDNKFVPPSSHRVRKMKESKFPRRVNRSNQDELRVSNRYEEDHVNNVKSCVTVPFIRDDDVSSELYDEKCNEKTKLTKQLEGTNYTGDDESSKFVTRMSDTTTFKSTTTIMSSDKDVEEKSSNIDDTKDTFICQREAHNLKSDIKVIKVQVEHVDTRWMMSDKERKRKYTHDQHHIPIDGNIESMKQIDVTDNMKGQREEKTEVKRRQKKKQQKEMSAVNNVTMRPVNNEESTSHLYHAQQNTTSELVNQDNTQFHRVSPNMKVDKKYNQMSNETDVTCSSVTNSSDTRVARVNDETTGHLISSSKNNISSVGAQDKSNVVNKNESTAVTTTTTTTATTAAAAAGMVANSTSLSSALATRSIVTGCKSVKEARKEKERKTAKTLAIITGVFIVCW